MTINFQQKLFISVYNEILDEALDRYNKVAHRPMNLIEFVNHINENNLKNFKGCLASFEIQHESGMNPWTTFYFREKWTYFRKPKFPLLIEDIIFTSLPYFSHENFKINPLEPVDTFTEYRMRSDPTKTQEKFNPTKKESNNNPLYDKSSALFVEFVTVFLEGKDHEIKRNKH